ncbi:hypothetical protein GW17_00060513, partial [Ensete ventricosum]
MHTAWYWYRTGTDNMLVHRYGSCWYTNILVQYPSEHSSTPINEIVNFDKKRYLLARFAISYHTDIPSSARYGM